jgi:hypothetical protein
MYRAQVGKKTMRFCSPDALYDPVALLASPLRGRPSSTIVMRMMRPRAVLLLASEQSFFDLAGRHFTVNPYLTNS